MRCRLVSVGACLCGLYTGVPLTRRSVQQSGVMPENIWIFRKGVIAAAGESGPADSKLREQIKLTVLHEMGHHFGLDEAKLRALGYH